MLTPPSNTPPQKAPAFDPQGPRGYSSFLVDIKDIHIGERMRQVHPDIDKMASSLLENGQIHAITVRPPSPDELAAGVTQPWVLVTGGRRLGGAVLAGWTQIRAENLEHLSEYRRSAVELEENLQRQQMTWQEEVAAKQRLTELYRKENPAWADFQTAQVLGENRGTVSRDLKLARAIEEHPELLKATGKKQALRFLETKQKMAAKNAAMSTFDMGSLESRLVNADAVDFLNTLPDSSVDLFLSDLPFGIDYFDMPSSDRKAGGGVSKFDDSMKNAVELINRALPLMFKKAKQSGWIMLMVSRELEWAVKNVLTIEKTQKRLDPGKKPTMTAVPWIWYRKNSRSSPIHPHLHAKSMYDIILVINMGQGQLARNCENVIEIDSVYTDRLHAHQKPVPLGEELITRVTAPGDFVVDITMGSGAFLAAAAKIDRQFAGCDLNPDIVPVAQAFVAPFAAGKLVPFQPTTAIPTPEVHVPTMITQDAALDIFGSEEDFAPETIDIDHEDEAENEEETWGYPADDEEDLEVDGEDDEEDDDLSDWVEDDEAEVDIDGV